MKLLSSASLFAALSSALVLPSSDPTSYDGFKVFRVKAKGQLSKVQEQLSSLTYDTWNQVSGSHIDVVVGPAQLEQFQNLGLDYHCMHEDLGESISTESAVPFLWKRQIDDMSWFDTYHPYDDHYQYFLDLQAAFPNNSEMVSSGTSYEGRDLFGIHLWGADGPGKPAVLWHGTVHAREWITAMVIEYLTNQLVTGYATDNYTQSYVDNYDFYIFPFVNPDGFVFSQTNNRLWRKNRQPPPSTAENQTCYGRDINRQWPFSWDESYPPGGSSPNPCSQTYRGESPSDGPESQGLVNYVDYLRDSQGIKLYIDWHSYGQYILSPWGYNCTVYPETLGQHTKLAALTGDAIRLGANGTTFTFGQSCSTLYATSGSSVDYIYGVGKAKFSYTIELRDTGDYGFVLPPEQIRGSVEEQWAGMQVMLYLLDEVFFDGEGPATLESEARIGEVLV